ncbi:unnamed protein product [Ectocarpus sp. CCAP 1310/34]|nr:unnamed protein product [Ectocarpus sp. CCAP 1310/34]
MADSGTERAMAPEDMPRLGPTWSRGGGMFKPPKRPEGHLEGVGHRTTLGEDWRVLGIGVSLNCWGVFRDKGLLLFAARDQEEGVGTGVPSPGTGAGGGRASTLASSAADPPSRKAPPVFGHAARGGLEALASATTQRGFAPRDGSGGLSGGTAAVETGGVGGVRIAAGPPPPETGGGGLGPPGRWDRERAASIDKRKVQRFSPEELLALRRAPTRPLGKMPVLGGDISIIVSEEPLEPVTATPADQEAISRVCGCG